MENPWEQIPLDDYENHKHHPALVLRMWGDVLMFS